MFVPPNSNDPNDWWNYQEAERMRKQLDTHWVSNSVHPNNGMNHHSKQIIYYNNGPSPLQYIVSSKFMEKHPGFATFYMGVSMFFGTILGILLLVFTLYMFVPEEVLETYHLSWIVDTCESTMENLQSRFHDFVETQSVPNNPTVPTM